MSIYIICGKPRKGKTLYVTDLLVRKMIYYSFEDVVNSKREIAKLKAGGFQNLEPPPQSHLCYADYRVKVNRRLQAYYIDGFKLGLPNPFFETVFIPPYSSIFLDEAQRYYNSRMSKYLREEVYGWFQLHGQNHYNVYLACQRIGNIDINIRSLAEKIFVIDGSEIIKDEYGRTKKIKINLHEFESADVAESYQNASEKNEISSLGVEKTIVSDFPLFDFYDSFANKPLFYLGQDYNSFDYYTEDGYEFTLDSFKEYNNFHYYSAPTGYWKNAERDKKILERLGS